jgi:hypothetical protein
VDFVYAQGGFEQESPLIKEKRKPIPNLKKGMFFWRHFGGLRNDLGTRVSKFTAKMQVYAAKIERAFTCPQNDNALSKGVAYETT